MAQAPVHVLAVMGSLQNHSVTRVVVRAAARQLEEAGCTVDILDLLAEPLELFNPDTSRTRPAYAAMRQRVIRADAFLLGTPDYHGGPSGALKNFLDHFWHEFAGKLFGTLVASHEKGLTVTDQLRTVIRQCYGWTLPYGVSFAEQNDVAAGELVSENLRQRLSMMTRDLRVYGQLLAAQRLEDLGCTDNCFMAKHR
jgi:FMN reductase